MTAQTAYGVDWQAVDRAVGRRFDWAVHPGEVLSEWLADNKMAKTDLAEQIGRHLSAVSRVCGGRDRVGVRLALDLEDVTGVRAEVWLHLQAAYDVHTERRRR